MAEGGHDGQDRGSRRADEAALSARLKRLGERLDDAHVPPPASGPAPRSTTDSSGLARGFRLSSELVAAVLAGAGLGWVIDRWVGTSPWGFIVLLLLGFVAGVVNVIRVAGVSPGGAPGGPPGNRI
jgi:ATP synthase protein I